MLKIAELPTSTSLDLIVWILQCKIKKEILNLL